MADSVTTNYNFVKPEVGQSNNTWGAKTNDNWDLVDALFLTRYATNAHLVPDTTATYTLGNDAKSFAGLHLGTGAEINWNNGDVKLVHSADTLSFTGAASGYFFSHAVESNRFSATATTGAALGNNAQITAGPTTGVNIAMFASGIQSRNNGAANTLVLNGLGGAITLSGTSAPANVVIAADTTGGALNAIRPISGGLVTLGTSSIKFDSLYLNTSADYSDSAKIVWGNAYIGRQGSSAALEVYAPNGTNFMGHVTFNSRIQSGAYFSTSSIPPATAVSAACAAVAGPSTGAAFAAFSSSVATRYAMTMENTNGIVGSITYAASTTTYSTTSDYRLKQDVVPLDPEEALDTIGKYRPVEFAFKSEPDDKIRGFLAHEFQEVAPWGATGSKDEEEAVGYCYVTPVYEQVEIIDVKSVKVYLLDEDGNATNILVDSGEVIETPTGVFKEVLVSPGRYLGVMSKEDAETLGGVWIEEGTRPVFQTIDASKAIPDMVAAIQALVQIVKDQSDRIKALEELVVV